MMEMEASIPVYEVDGKGAKNTRLKVLSHRNDKSMVILVVGGAEYLVGATDLERAIQRCAHY